MASFDRSSRFNTGIIVREGIDTDSLKVGGNAITGTVAGPTGPTGPSGGPTGPTGSGGPTGPAGTASSSAPSTASSTGTAGTIAYDSTHIYVCIATNTWVRASLATF